MVYNIDFLLASLIFLSVVLHHFMKQRTMDFGQNRSFMWLIIICFLNISFDVICTILISLESPELWVLTEISLVVLYMLQLLAPAILLYHILSQFTLKEQFKKMRYTIATIPITLGVLLILNHWGHFLFTVGSDGSYERGPLYIFMYLSAGLYLGAVLVCTRKHQMELSREKYKAIYELLFFTGLTVVIQAVNHDLLVAGLGIALGVTVLFFTLDNPYHYTDSLTKTFDINYFRDRFQNSLDTGKPFQLLVVKLPELKRINMILGAEIGNELLVCIARILRSGKKRNKVFRTSGNTYMVITFRAEEHRELYNKLVRYFSKPVSLAGKLVQVSAKVSSITDARSLESSDTVLSYVDYLFKQPTASTQPEIFVETEETREGFRRYKRIEAFLETAVRQNLFETVYQPIYSNTQKKFVALEALSRLHHPELGWISPMVFIEMAEKNNQITQIGLLQLRRIIEFFTNHPKLFEQIQNVKINLSPLELMKPDHVNQIIRTLKQSELPADRFQFEVTETIATEYTEVLEGVVKQFAAAGIKLCMDDFGSGYSNLNTAMRFPFAVIKMDRSLLSGICTDPRVAALYQSCVKTFHNIGYAVVAEGVETGEELKVVSDWGVDMIQGYYFSKPLREEELLTFFHTA